jgi:nucleoside-diphosphate-sugar epimerase
MIFLTGSSGFIGNCVINYFGIENILKHTRDTDFDLNNSTSIIHLAGKSQDNKNIYSFNEYYKVNTELTMKLYNCFLTSKVNTFIYFSSVKAVADEVIDVLTEDHNPQPVTHYGKSKLLAEEYILSQKIPFGKRVYILRPTIVHGPGNKGNLSLLYRLISKNIPWPFGYFENKRSYCSIDNLMFVIKELIERKDIPSGIYNITDDEPISTNNIICLIADVQNKKPKIWYISKKLLKYTAILGNYLHLPFNSQALQKLTTSYVVSNQKIKNALCRQLPVSSIDGLKKTFISFK